MLHRLVDLAGQAMDVEQVAIIDDEELVAAVCEF